jgi:hypothetical protein
VLVLPGFTGGVGDLAGQTQLDTQVVDPAGQRARLEDNEVRSLLEEAAEVVAGGIERLEAAFCCAALIAASDALVFAQIEGENSAGGCRRVGGGRVPGASSWWGLVVAGRP